MVPYPILVSSATHCNMDFALLCLVPLLTAAGPLEQRQESSSIQGTCSGFCGAVINIDACNKAGWLKVWDTLTSHGVTDSGQDRSFAAVFSKGYRTDESSRFLSSTILPKE